MQGRRDENWLVKRIEQILSENLSVVIVIGKKRVGMSSYGFHCLLECCNNNGCLDRTHYLLFPSYFYKSKPKGDGVNE